MQMLQEQTQKNLIVKFYLFLRDRDAKIIELFFFCFNTYILLLVILPPYGYDGWALIIRTLVQLIITGVNFAALFTQTRLIRVISSIANATILAFISLNLVRLGNVHAGTYVLLTLLAIFVTWKINVR